MGNTHTVIWQGLTITFDIDAQTAEIVSSSQTELNVDEIWAAFLASDLCANDPFLHDLADSSRPKRIFGTNSDDNITSSSNGGMFSGNGDDTITATAQNGRGQFHTFAANGDDTTNFEFAEITKYSHGHHSRGGFGDNIFNFTNISNVSDTIVGRIEDYDYSRDKLQIEGQNIDLHNLPSNVRLVEFNGNYNDSMAEPQLWLLIETSSGGYIFYAFDGARVDIDGDGGANSGKQEAHFIELPDGFDFESLKDVEFIDKQNYVPKGYSPDGGATINDVDADATDIFETINGTARGDLIGAGLNDDVVDAGSGHDIVWGGDGNDTINGQRGRDSLIGGTGNDTINGGGGRDVIKGGLGDDIIFGGKGRDRLYGEDGNDEISGGRKHDKLYGGDGDDIINGGKDNDVLIGGSGSDVFVFKKNDGIDKIRDFEDGIDLISIKNHSYEDLVITESDNQIIVRYGDTDEINIRGVELIDLTEADFIFF